MLSFDEHGNRKTTSKHTKPSQNSEPYQLNRVNSMYALSTTSPGESPCCNSPISSSDSAPERRMSKSEAASPLMTGSSGFTHQNGQLPPLDISAIEYSAWSKFDMFTDQEQPMFSAGLSATSIDWSLYDGLDFGARAAGDFAPSNYSQPQSYGGFDMNGSEQPPTLTTNTSTSGEPSEIDDPVPPSSFDDLDVSTASHGFSLGPLPDSFLSSTDFATGLDYEFKLAKAENQYLPTPASLSSDDPILSTTGPAAFASYSSLVADDPTLWTDNDYQTHGLPGADFPLAYTDSPDGTMPNYCWDGQ